MRFLEVAEQSLPVPDRDRLSSLAALLLIAYGLARFAFLPPLGIQLPVLGLLISLEVNSRTVMMLLATALAVSGCDGVMRDHPQARGADARTWILPGLAAVSFGDALARLPLSAGWWLGLGLAGLVVLASIVVEFLLVDSADPRAQLAAAALPGLGVLVLAVLFFDLRASGTRAVFLVPLVFGATLLVGGRILSRGPQGWPGIRYPAAVAGVVAEIAFALHYWPLHPIQFALLLMASAYVGWAFVEELRDGRLNRKRTLELGALALAVLCLTVLLR